MVNNLQMIDKISLNFIELITDKDVVYNGGNKNLDVNGKNLIIVI